ncbi:MAG: 2-phospho-L-lactate transferase CofD family protein [Desulfurivibrionaceae bacterium]
MPAEDKVADCFKRLSQIRLEPFDLLPRRSLVEKVIDLVLFGPPEAPPHITAGLADMAATIDGIDTGEVKVVALGGGTGLANVIGGDSRNPDWPDDPFQGLKQVFPKTSSIVCVTDDGGSTGELLKDLPVIGLGDIRHVLLSSIQEERLKNKYRLSREGACRTVRTLHGLFNHRFTDRAENPEELISCTGFSVDYLPGGMKEGLKDLLAKLFTDTRLQPLLERPHCLGNLLLTAAIYNGNNNTLEVGHEDFMDGLSGFAELIGADPEAVYPCTLSQGHLNVLYANGVMVSGESKISSSRRKSPVDRVFVEFVEDPVIPEQVARSIKEADVIVFAPGSLYSSITPILQIPGFADLIRSNEKAMKILVANIWAQKGETDVAPDNPRRRFHVSDLINAYHRNIPGGVEGLFEQVLLLGLQDIPGSILQNYAVEEKAPIYLDRGRVRQMGFTPIEARIFSEPALKDGKVQHNPESLAQAIKTIQAIREHIPGGTRGGAYPPYYRKSHCLQQDSRTLNQKRALREEHLERWWIGDGFRGWIRDILWRHQDILPAHLELVQGLKILKREEWNRSQKWDNVMSFYGPEEKCIYIREDVPQDQALFEFAFLVALGQSLLGNYAAGKEMVDISRDGIKLGRAFKLHLRPEGDRACYFRPDELDQYLRLVRMCSAADNELLYTRLINGMEGFTPPGMMMGLIYAWYLDSSFSSNIDYKMAITRLPVTDLISEHIKTFRRRQETIRFFRRVVFGHDDPVYEAEPVCPNGKWGVESGD